MAVRAVGKKNPPSDATWLWKGRSEEVAPPVDQFRAWLDGEPPMSEWAKKVPTSPLMREIKRQSRENL